ncbi:hypothetical protein M9458_037564 [Cirrhinus mrigala]|uniref:Uncharacterized protein n=1 Tax=Cirrhinus mrigala TaxID=683832 RepID=A0ABD0NW34_CIRMR
MLEEKYRVTEDQAVAQVSISDIWTSINMDAYLALTCHFITEEIQLSTILLGVKKKIPRFHIAAQIAEAKDTLMAEWGIRDKVRSLITDAAQNMVACANLLNVRHINRFAYMLNLVVKKSTLMTFALGHGELWRISNQTPQQKRSCQKYSFRWENQNINFYKRLKPTRNSTFTMYQTLYEQRKPLGVALTGLNTTLLPLSADV